ncbi:hypothetical protein JCM10207_002943 [Rhodosporidiobolus poonsookiae]
MTDSSPDDAFRLGRLRLVRLPPSFISLPAGAKKPTAVPIELAVGATDDYGVDLMFDALEMQLELLDAETLKPPSGVTLRLNGSSSNPSSASTAATFTFSPSRGPFHILKPQLVFAPSSPSRPPPKTLTFRLSAANPSFNTAPTPSAASARIRQTLGETEQEVLESWEEERYVFLSLRSGPVEVRVEGKEAKTASDKVQTALRTISLPSPPRSPAPDALTSSTIAPSPSTPSSSQITIVERPGLNNSTGQRLWDCAIGLSAFFSLYPDMLDASIPLPAPLPNSYSAPSISLSADDSPQAKRPRLDVPARNASRKKVIELGAGCALASMAAQRLLPDLEVLATDVEATVDTTLRENLEFNSLADGVRAEVLDWGDVAPDQLAELTGKPGALSSLVLIGSDILYNPSSHALLLSTLLSFLRPPSPTPTALDGLPVRAIIAYKHRTEGDDGFFPLAEGAGLRVERVWSWGEVGVYVLE